MLKSTKNGLLNLDSVNIWSVQVATHFPNYDFHDTIVVVKKNRIKYLSNYIQAQNFALSQNIELIFFLAEHSWNKKDEGHCDSTDPGHLA